MLQRRDPREPVIRKIGSVDCIQQGTGDPVLFLHGLGLHPRHYVRFLEKLAATYEVIAPIAYGMNCFDPQPRSVEEYKELTLDVHRKMRGAKHLVGHSLGGGIAMLVSAETDVQDVVAMNPILPVDYGFGGFAWRGVWKGMKEVVGVHGEVSSTRFGLELPIPFAMNMLMGLPSFHTLVTDICNFTYEPTPVRHPTLVVFGEKDEYFALNEGNTDLLGKMGVDLKRLPKHNHDWPIFSPARAADEVVGYHTRGKP